MLLSLGYNHYPKQKFFHSQGHQGLDCSMEYNYSFPADLATLDKFSSMVKMRRT